MLTSWTKASYLLTDCDCSICCHSWNVLFHLSLEILQYHRLFHKRQVTARCSITCRSNCTVVQCSIFVDQKEDKFYDISDVLYCVSVSNVAKMCSTQGPSVRRATPETIFILMLRTDRYYWFTLLQYGPSASHLHHLRIHSHTDTNTVTTNVKMGTVHDNQWQWQWRGLCVVFSPSD